MKSLTYTQARKALTICGGAANARGYQTLGQAMFFKCGDRDGAIKEIGEEWEDFGWPQCECTGCDCDEPATCTDDQGIPTCTGCQDYTTDDDGNVLCAKCDGVETVVESCGAGNQTRTYLRQSPPEMPEEDETGEWALYWETVGDDAGVVARFSSRDIAEQAVRAKDWPRPGDRTHYLCGYEVRQFVDGEWIAAAE